MSIANVTDCYRLPNQIIRLARLKGEKQKAVHLCELLCFATNTVSPAVGGELGICKERSDGIVSKANVTVAQRPNSEQSSNEQIGVNKKGAQFCCVPFCLRPLAKLRYVAES